EIRQARAPPADTRPLDGVMHQGVELQHGATSSAVPAGGRADRGCASTHGRHPTTTDRPPHPRPAPAQPTTPRPTPPPHLDPTGGRSPGRPRNEIIRPEVGQRVVTTASAGVGFRSERGPILLATMLSTSLVAIDSTILATAIPSIVSDLG